MKSKAIMNSVTAALNKASFKLKKHSPEILVVVGTIGVVASAVMACKATTKATKVVEQAKEDVETIHEAVENGVTNAGEEYTVEDSQKELTQVYVQTGVELVKLYAPAVILGALSLTGIVTSNRILRKRNVALAAAYATVDKSFKQYQNNVIERFGEKVHKELKYNVKKEEVEETVIDENGKEKTVKKVVDVVDCDLNVSQYAKFFDELSDEWTDNAEYNLTFLRNQERFANQLLQSRGKGGRVFLNEIYKSLGFEPTKAGQVVGWIYDPDDPTRDSYISFGIYDINRRSSRRFVNGIEPAILLDFNVDGNIWEDM